jgi:sugar phosphate isomerase/epimerase
MDRKRRVLAMNNPGEELHEEIPFLLDCGVDAVELTAELPLSYVENIKAHWELVRAHVGIGHTRDDLMLASEVEEERISSIVMMNETLQLFKELGVTRVNVHPHRGSKGLSPEEVLRLNVSSLNEIAAYADGLGIELMLENQPPFPLVNQIAQVFEGINHPIFLLLDLAHAVCYGGDDEAVRFIETFGPRIKHIHVSDNRGSTDDHLFPGYGVVNLAKYAELIKKHVPADVSVSLESFRVETPAGLEVVSAHQRKKYVSVALGMLKELF